jgi:hypothetical protein
VRTRFGRLAAAKGISLKGIQVHHTFAELAKVPSEALTTTNLSFQRGHAGKEGSGHNFAHKVNEAARDPNIKNPGQHVRADLEAKGVRPDVPELGPKTPDKPKTPDAPKKPKTPKTPKTPKGKKIGGGTVGKVVAIGIGLYVYFETGDAVAAAQTANPAANTTDELVLKEGKATAGGTAEAAAKDIYGLTPVATVEWLATSAVEGTHYVFREHVHTPIDEELAAKAIREGRNPFCAQCHGPGGALDPNNKWNQQKNRASFTFPEFTEAEQQQFFQWVQGQSK